MIDSNIRILLADHQELVRCGLQRVLDDIPGLEVVGVASSAEDAVRVAQELCPDIVLIAVHISGMGGLEATRRIVRNAASSRVVAVAEQVDDPFPTHLLEAGASGYLTRYCTVEEIVTALHTVQAGERYVSADVARQMALTLQPGRDHSVFERLTQREMQILVLVAQGRRIQEISEHLCLSPKTVCTYRYRLYDRLGVDSDVELAHLAIRHGIVGHPGNNLELAES